jgi:hypothetical protein
MQAALFAAPRLNENHDAGRRLCSGCGRSKTDAERLLPASGIEWLRCGRQLPDFT